MDITFDLFNPFQFSNLPFNSGNAGVTGHSFNAQLQERHPVPCGVRWGQARAFISGAAECGDVQRH